MRKLGNRVSWSVGNGEIHAGYALKTGVLNTSSCYVVTLYSFNSYFDMRTCSIAQKSAMMPCKTLLYQ